MLAGRILRAWATVAAGHPFLPHGQLDESRRSRIADFRCGGSWPDSRLDILWSAVQGATFYLNVLPKPLVTQWQRLFSLRELIRTNRISGMAYEPSWLAGQICHNLHAVAACGAVSGVRIPASSGWSQCLLASPYSLLLATFSRGGLLTAGFAAVLTVILVGQSQIRAAWAWLRSGVGRGRNWAPRLAVVLLCGALAGGALLFLGQKNYIARLWNTRASSVSDFLIQNSAGARAAYMLGALDAYQAHPWLGVGLGSKRSLHLRRPSRLGAHDGP